MTISDTRINEAKAILTQSGYVVLKQKSYQRAQERQRIAECYRRSAEEEVASVRTWAQEAYQQTRDLMARCTFLYGAARAHGATMDELRGSWLSCPECGS